MCIIICMSTMCILGEASKIKIKLKYLINTSGFMYFNNLDGSRLMMMMNDTYEVSESSLTLTVQSNTYTIVLSWSWNCDSKMVG
jgi:hypothetical protein